MRGRGRPQGARYCDFKTLISFLQLFRKAPLTVYRLYHESGRGWDLKKIYRYLRYSADLKLLEIDHVEKMPGPLPAKWWRLTERGQELLNWYLKHGSLGASGNFCLPRQPQGYCSVS